MPAVRSTARLREDRQSDRAPGSVPAAPRLERLSFKEDADGEIGLRCSSRGRKRDLEARFCSPRSLSCAVGATIR